MTASNAGSSLRTLLIALLVVGSLTTACKTSGSGSDVDPRDQYVGTYEGGDGSYNSAISFASLPPFEEKGKSTITITKSINPKEIYLDISNRPLKVTAELNGTKFTVVDRTSDQINVVFNGQQYVYDGNYTATGAFDVDQASGKNLVAINAVTETLQLGTTIRRVETIVAIRK